MPRFSLSELNRFIEAVVLLTAASIAIRVLPFRAVVRLMGRAPLVGTRQSGHTHEIRRAVKRASRRLPWKTVCFQQGLAAHWMLRRRGVDSRLHYGLRPSDDRLSAHVWIEAGGQVVIGEEEQRSAHQRVAVFPGDDGAAAAQT